MELRPFFLHGFSFVAPFTVKCTFAFLFSRALYRGVPHGGGPKCEKPIIKCKSGSGAPSPGGIPSSKPKKSDFFRRLCSHVFLIQKRPSWNDFGPSWGVPHGGGPKCEKPIIKCKIGFGAFARRCLHGKRVNVNRSFLYLML